MKIDTNGIQGYADMTAEEKIAALEGFEFEDATSLKATIEKTKASLNKASSEAADYKRKYNSTLSDTEKQIEELTSRNNELAEKLAKADRDNLINRLKADLIGQHYSSELAEKKANALADNDYTALIEIEKQYADEREKEIRAEVARLSPRPDGGNGADVNIDKASEVAAELGKKRKAETNTSNDILNKYFK